MDDNIDRFTLLEELGSGTISTVFRASSPSGEEVALKLTRQRPEASNPEWEIRLEREAEALSRLNHPGIVRLHDYGWWNQRFYLATELLSGQSLAHILRQKGKLEPKQAATIMLKVSEALSHVHQEGILHRDVKPSNIVVSFNETIEVKIIDLGLARLRENFAKEQNTVGTVLYMAPEQLHILPRPTDGRSDLYGVGLVGYELLTGGSSLRRSGTRKTLA